MTSNIQLIFVFVFFVIYLLPRAYKNFLLTFIVYLVMIYVDNDQYFKKCASTERLCKLFNILFVTIFGIHAIFGLLLVVGDIKVMTKHRRLHWGWCVPNNYRHYFLFNTEKVHTDGSLASMVDSTHNWYRLYCHDSWIHLFGIDRLA